MLILDVEELLNILQFLSMFYQTVGQQYLVSYFEINLQLGYK